MRFGRVTGVIVRRESPDGIAPASLQLTVTLDTGTVVETVRSEHVPELTVPPGVDELVWQADQYTQETIANELALRGWEPIGIAADATEARGASVGRSSPTYLVRQP